MIKKGKRNALLLLSGIIVCVLFLKFAVNVENEKITEIACYTYGEKSIVNTKIVEQEVAGQRFLFLPSGTKSDEVHLFFNCPKGQKLYLDGEPIKGELVIDLKKDTAYQESSSSYLLHLNMEINGVKEDYDLNIMTSEHLKSFYITSDDQENCGKDWVNATPDHSNMASGMLYSLDADGQYLLSQTIERIRVHGNTTTLPEKKAYQIKLQNSEDLLGISEPGKDWVLLANAYDATLQHNLVAYQMGKELGLADSPDCEPIDLYYDGEYIGNYLLSEKVEVQDYRVNITKQKNKQNSDEAVIAQAENQYGDLVQYVENVETSEDYNDGYLIQLDVPHYQQKNSYFRLNDDFCFGMEYPKNCSLSQMQQVSELWHELLAAVENGGINPDTGKNIEDYMDIDSFARYYLVQQLSKNPDAFSSSTYCYIPQDEEKIYFGALWDFDISYGIDYFYTDQEGVSALLLPEGLYPEKVASELACIPVVQQKIKEREDELFEIVDRVLLSGEEKGTYLKSIQDYADELEASQKMNYARWPGGLRYYYPFETYEESVAYFQDFLEQRNVWLHQEVESWTGTGTVDSVKLCVEQPLDGMPIEAAVSVEGDFSGVWLISAVCDSEDSYFSKEHDYMYQVVLEAGYGTSFAENLSVHTSSGVVCDVSIDSDGKAMVEISPEKPMLTGTVYGGVNYAPVYDKNYYLSHYPEAAEKTDGSDEAVLEYYVENGIPAGHQAAEDFSIQYYMERYPFLGENFGNDYRQIVMHYLTEGYPGGLSGKPD